MFSSSPFTANSADMRAVADRDKERSISYKTVAIPVWARNGMMLLHPTSSSVRFLGTFLCLAKRAVGVDLSLTSLRLWRP